MMPFWAAVICMALTLNNFRDNCTEWRPFNMCYHLSPGVCLIELSCSVVEATLAFSIQLVSTQVNVTCCDVSPTHREAHYPTLTEARCRPRSVSHGATWIEREPSQASAVTLSHWPGKKKGQLLIFLSSNLLSSQVNIVMSALGLSVIIIHQY